MKLFPYQQECVNEIDWFLGRALLTAEPGLGKTLMSLSWLMLHPEAWPAVVTCPASVKFVWEREALNFFGVKSRVLEGMTPDDAMGKCPPLLIVNYDILTVWLPWLRKHRPRTIIMDECQLISNPRAQRSRAARKLCKRRPYVLALSGTPLMNKPIELFNILNILCPAVFNSRREYIDEYCDPTWTPWGVKYTGATNTKQLHDLLIDTCMVRRRKVDVLKDLPEKLRSVVPVSLSDPSEYRRASDDFLSWLRMQDPRKAKSASRAEALTKVGYMLRLAARLKMNAVADWINDFLRGSDEKLVVFAVHKDVIAELLERIKAKAVVINGSVTGRARDRLVDQFQTDDRTRVLLGNIEAAGVGLTLTAASTVLLIELTGRPGDLVQAEDRCHRIGTRSTVWCHYLVAKGTIEERMCEIVQRKQRVLSSVLDGGPNDDDLDVYDELLEELRREYGGRIRP
jgi:SWI/SNF-related matrix-associated actin-dependent regulator 1 of chromatin subfamily A